MKAVLYVCVLFFIAFSSTNKSYARKESNTVEDLAMEIVTPFIEARTTCMAENNMTEDKTFSMMDIVNGVHKKPENEARRREYGCILECAMQKRELMNGTQIYESKVHTRINFYGSSRHYIRNWVHQVADDCMTEARNVTDVCDKMFTVYDCVMIEIYEGFHRKVNVIDYANYKLPSGFVPDNNTDIPERKPRPIINGRFSRINETKINEHEQTTEHENIEHANT